MHLLACNADRILPNRKGEQMKSKRCKNGLGLFVLFIEFLAIIFAGFCLCNVLAITIDCVFDGFNSFWERIMNLPFLLYLGFSFVISIVLTIPIYRKTK